MSDRSLQPYIGATVHVVLMGAAGPHCCAGIIAALAEARLPDGTPAQNAARIFVLQAQPQGTFWVDAVHDEIGKQPGSYHLNLCKPNGIVPARGVVMPMQ